MDKNNNEHIGGIAINVGNPHVIFFVKSIDNFNIKKIGPSIENDKLFPEKCNVTLAKLVNKNLVRVKVWERGAGLTKACGTAACATAISASILNLSQRMVDIEFNEGLLNIDWNSNNNIYMTGKVSSIKEILINI